MIENYLLYNDYWDDKRAKFENLTIPMYVLASYSTALHTEGSVGAFLYSASPAKWLVYIIPTSKLPAIEFDVLGCAFIQLRSGTTSTLPWRLMIYKDSLTNI